MNRAEIRKLILERNKDRIFITPSKVSKITGFGWKAVSEILKDTDFKVVGNNGARHYLVSDVTDAIIAHSP